MRLKKIKVENIRSYEGGEITFPLGSTLLSGDIGSGKTSILLAIEFALFGLQPNQRGSSLLRNNENNAGVRLELEVDGKEVILERTLKKSKSITQDSSSITIDNEKYEGSVTETKNKILALLNYPQEFAKKTNLLYRFTVYTPQEEMKQIILEPKDTRLNTLRHVFGIDKYKRIEDNTELITSKLRAGIRENEIRIQSLDSKKQSLEEKKSFLSKQKEELLLISDDLEKIKQKRISKQEEIEQINKKLEEKKNLETEKTKSEVMLSSKKSEFENILSSISNLNSQIQEAKKLVFNEEEFNSLKARLAHAEERTKQLNEEYIEIVSKINTQQSRKKEAEDIQGRIAGMRVCPTCRQDVNEEYKNIIFSKIDNEIQAIDKNLQEYHREKQQHIIKIEEVKKQTELSKKQISESEILKIKLETLKEKEKDFENLKKQEEQRKKDIYIIEKQILVLEKSISDYKIFEEQYKSRDKEFQEIKNEENQALIKQAETKKEIQFSETQIKELQQEISELKKIKEKLEYTRELEFWLSNKFLHLILYTEKNVMLKLREEFSKLFADWFSVLVSDELSIRLDENFSPIIQKQDYELDYAYLSGGERTAVALAYRLALNQVINSILSRIKTRDLLILDEPTDGFSEQQLDKMRDVLSQLNVAQLILVSHESKIESFVENIIKFKKENGITKIEE